MLSCVELVHFVKSVILDLLLGELLLRGLSENSVPPWVAHVVLIRHPSWSFRRLVVVPVTSFVLAVRNYTHVEVIQPQVQVVDHVLHRLDLVSILDFARVK